MSTPEPSTSVGDGSTERPRATSARQHDVHEDIGAARSGQRSVRRRASRRLSKSLAATLRSRSGGPCIARRRSPGAVGAAKLKRSSPVRCYGIRWLMRTEDKY